MRVLVVCDDSKILAQAAAAVVKGAQAAGASADSLKASEIPRWPDGFQEVDVLVLGASDEAGFIRVIGGLSKMISWSGKSSAIYCVGHNASSMSKVVENARLRLHLQNSKVLATLILHTHGMLRMFGRGTLNETDLARASALGERCVHAAAGTRPQTENEKTRIKGYLKK